MRCQPRVSPPGRAALFEERAHALDAVGFGEIVDHRERRYGISLVERPLDLVVERALADRQRRSRLLRDRLGQRLRLLDARGPREPRG